MVAFNVKSKTKKKDRDLWATPNEIVKGSLAYFKQRSLVGAWKEYFIDVCASKHNTKCQFYLTEQDNSLQCNWFEFIDTANQVAWCNPPYSRGLKEQFIAKAIEQAKFGVETIMLLPNDTSAKWFSEVVKNAKAVVFICNGRINFINNATGERGDGNNAGSILVLFTRKEANTIAKTLYVTRERLEKMGA